MPPKKTASTKLKAPAHVNGLKTKESPKASTKPVKAPAKTAPKAIKTIPSRKRKALDEEGHEQVNGIHPRAASASVEPPKRVANKTLAKPTAVKRPRIAKKRDIINHAPTERLNVYVFGDGSAGGELGLGSGKGQKEVRRPRLNPHLSPETVGVVQVTCGGMHTACLTHDNKVLTWGVNDQGALGRDTSWEGGLRDVTENEASDDDSDNESEGELNPHESTPGEVDFSTLKEMPTFTQVACTDSATFALTAEGDVYGWGTFRSNEGLFGFSRNALIQNQPTIVEGLKKITQLATGSNHVLALDNAGDVWAWGSGQQNQLGRRVIERHQANSLRPTKFGLKRGAVLIGAGSYHSFAVNKNGDVYSWGLNSFGETGIPRDESEDSADVHHPAIIESLRNFGKVTQIEGGAHHSIAVTERGECLVWGRLDGFQLGIKLSTLPEENLVKDSHGQARILSVPTRVPGIDAVHVAAGTDHSIAITRDGRAYSWGFSLSCQTGLGTEDDVEVATLIDNTAVRGKKLVWAGAGGQFSVIAGLPGDAIMANGVNGHV